MCSTYIYSDSCTSCILLQPPSEEGSDPTSGVLSSPNFPHNYPLFSDCVWKLVAPKGYFISLRFLSNVDIEDKLNCKYDYLDLFLLNSQGEQLADNSHLCGSLHASQLNSALSGNTELQTQAVVVHFHSDGTYIGTGFQLSYTLQGNKLL